MHLNLGQVPAIVASSKETASEIFKTQDLMFCSRPQLIASTHLSYGGLDIAFSPYNEHWKMLRRFGNAEIFSASKVQSFRAIRDEEVRILLKTIRKNCSVGKPVNLSKMAVCFFNNIIFREVFGKRTSADGECVASRHQDLVTAVIDLLPGFSVGDFFPRFWWMDFVTGWRLKHERSFREMDRLFEEEIMKRQLKRSNKGRDEEEVFLDGLLRCEVEKDPLLGFLLSRNETKALLMDIFFTATETAAVVQTNDKSNAVSQTLRENARITNTEQ